MKAVKVLTSIFLSMVILIGIISASVFITLKSSIKSDSIMSAIKEIDFSEEEDFGFLENEDNVVSNKIMEAINDSEEYKEFCNNLIYDTLDYMVYNDKAPEISASDLKNIVLSIDYSQYGITLSNADKEEINLLIEDAVDDANELILDSLEDYDGEELGETLLVFRTLTSTKIITIIIISILVLTAVIGLINKSYMIPSLCLGISSFLSGMFLTTLSSLRNPIVSSIENEDGFTNTFLEILNNLFDKLRICQVLCFILGLGLILLFVIKKARSNKTIIENE